MVMGAREQLACYEEAVTGPGTIKHFTIPNILPHELYVLNNYVSLDVEKWRALVSGLGLWEKARNIRRKISL